MQLAPTPSPVSPTAAALLSTASLYARTWGTASPTQSTAIIKGARSDARDAVALLDGVAHRATRELVLAGVAALDAALATPIDYRIPEVEQLTARAATLFQEAAGALERAPKDVLTGGPVTLGGSVATVVLHPPR